MGARAGIRYAHTGIRANGARGGLWTPRARIQPAIRRVTNEGANCFAAFSRGVVGDLRDERHGAVRCYPLDPIGLPACQSIRSRISLTGSVAFDYSREARGTVPLAGEDEGHGERFDSVRCGLRSPAFLSGCTRHPYNVMMPGFLYPIRIISRPIIMAARKPCSRSRMVGRHREQFLSN